MAKCSAPGCRGKSAPLSHPSRKVKTAKGLSRNDLCALCLLFVHSLVFIPGGSRESKRLIPKRGKEPRTAKIREDAENREKE
jgi:hypothetical protein